MADFERDIKDADSEIIHVSLYGEGIYIEQGFTYEPTAIHYSKAKELCDAIMAAAKQAEENAKAVK